VSDTRRLAVEALLRIEDGAYANLVTPQLLGRSELEPRDRALVTDLVYGTTRMRRACDWLVDRYLTHDPPPPLRAALRIGAYQLAFLGMAPHAAVDTAVGVAPKRFRGVANAVLRKVARDVPVEWPNPAIALSYPDWLIARLERDLGTEEARSALAQMNEPAEVTERGDGYIQDRASQWVVDVVDAQPGERVADVCAAPGGKATALASTGASVVAMDLASHRARLVADNATRLGASVAVVVADATQPPVRAASFDRVLLDAPCSGLGVLRRRPDARWRIDEAAIARLGQLQRRLLASSADLVRPGGRLVYSVCTLTIEESTEVAAVVPAGFEPIALEDRRWRPHGTGGLLLPQDAGTDGMSVFAWTRVR
jgi:16S rRNA (cytosine967-C5)-methyltransferase